MISTILCVRNEEHRIEACIQNIRRFVDEVLVIDQDSTDETRRIAERLADKVYGDRCWGYGEPSREMAAALCEHDWVFLIDADEVLDGPDTVLRKALATHTGLNVTGFAVTRITTVNGCIIAREQKLRLFDRRCTTLGATVHTDPVLNSGELRDLSVDEAILRHDKTSVEQERDNVRGDRLVSGEAGYLCR